MPSLRSYSVTAWQDATLDATTAGDLLDEDRRHIAATIQTLTTLCRVGFTFTADDAGVWGLVVVDHGQFVTELLQYLQDHARDLLVEDRTALEALVPLGNRPFRRALFCVEPDQALYEGYTRGETWNGAECPLFPKNSAERVLADCSDDTLRIQYDAEADAFRIRSRDWPDQEDVLVGQDIVVAHALVHVYDFGHMGWAWIDEAVATRQYGAGAVVEG